jgi:hypothetical protein
LLRALLCVRHVSNVRSDVEVRRLELQSGQVPQLPRMVAREAFMKADPKAKRAEDTATVTIIKGAGAIGLSVYVNDLRIAGQKPLGGGKILGEWTVPRADVREAIAEKQATRSKRIRGT